MPDTECQWFSTNEYIFSEIAKVEARISHVIIPGVFDFVVLFVYYYFCWFLSMMLKMLKILTEGLLVTFSKKYWMGMFRESWFYFFQEYFFIRNGDYHVNCYI